MSGHGRPEEPSTAQGQAAKAEHAPAYLKPWVARYGHDIAAPFYAIRFGRGLMETDAELTDYLAVAIIRTEESGPQGKLFAERARIDLATGIGPEDRAVDLNAENPGDPDEEIVRFGKRT